MNKQGLNIAPPPRKASAVKQTAEKKTPKQLSSKQQKPNDTERVVSFDNVGGDEKVQFNKRVTRNTADGFEMLAIKTRKKVPELLEEALEMLEKKYGKS